jgi:hypothetical protein
LHYVRQPEDTKPQLQRLVQNELHPGGPIYPVEDRREKRRLLPPPTLGATWAIDSDEGESIEFGHTGLIRLAASTDATGGNAHGFDAHY